LLQGFLTAAECRHVIGLADDKFSRSLVFDTVTGEIREDPSRTSTSVMLKREQDAVVKRIEQRAAEAAGVPLDHLEPLQVVRYEPGQKFAAHHDYFGPLLLKGDRAGDRLVTIFVYLNDLDALELGGGTRFHVPNKTVRPKEGCAALWYNMRRGSDGLPAVDPSTLHSGEPLHMSTKYGINIWAREHRYR
jgi:prolyl 4-hydroxylase